MTRARKSRTRKSSPRIVIPLPYASKDEIKRGKQLIEHIFETCRSLETELREQRQNPLAETFRFLNLAEPRLSEKAIERSVRPFFYFSLQHDRISNQQAFQDTVRTRLNSPDAVEIFDTLIRRYFQAFDYRVDGRNGKKTFSIMLGPPAYEKPVTRYPFHAMVSWGKSGTSPIHIAKSISWKNCEFVVSIGKLSATITTAFKRSLRYYLDHSHSEFLSIAQPLFIARLADPADRHRLDHYLINNTPTPTDVLEYIAEETARTTAALPSHALISYSARHHTETQINALNQAITYSYAGALNQKFAFYPPLSRQIPLQFILQTLYLEPEQAAKHLQSAQNHPVQHLLLDAQTLRDANLSPDTPIYQTHTLPADNPSAEIIRKARQTYLTEQRLATILRAAIQAPQFGFIFPEFIAASLADKRFFHTRLGDLNLDSRTQTTLFRFVRSYIARTLPALEHQDASDITLGELRNPPPHHDPIYFSDLPTTARQQFDLAFIQHLAHWRSTYTPPAAPARQQAASETINALQEINDLFET